MKVVILAGGRGTRLSEETVARPKPMVEIGDRPILWHIMKIFGEQGFNEFIIALGYRGFMIKEYFSNYFLHTSDVTFDFVQNAVTHHAVHAEPWKVTLVETGLDTMTGGRIRRLAPYLNPEEPFFCTYGDGLADVDLARVAALHRESKRLAAVTAVQPPGRFGALAIEGDAVRAFQEKPVGDGGWINGGFFVFLPKVVDYIEGDSTILEQEPLRRLASDDQLVAYKHDGFFQPMDTLRDKQRLEELWSSGRAPWAARRFA